MAKIKIVNYDYFDLTSPEAKKCLLNGHYKVDMIIENGNNTELYCKSPSFDELNVSVMVTNGINYLVNLQISSNEVDYGSIY